MRKKMAPRTSKAQYQIYIKALEENKYFVNNKFPPGFGPAEADSLWEGLTSKLNAADGPVRNSKGWRKFFCEMKSFIRKKSRTGKTLQPHERKILILTGRFTVKDFTDNKSGILDASPTSTRNDIEDDEESVEVNYVAIEEPKEELETQAPARETPTPKHTTYTYTNCRFVGSRFKKRTSSSSIDSYVKGAKEIRAGLSDIAGALRAIAKSIDTIGDTLNKL